MSDFDLRAFKAMVQREADLGGSGDRMVASEVLEALRACEPTWIRCEDRMPEDGDKVLGLVAPTVIEMLVWEADSNMWGVAQSEDYYERGYITHWMPLPDAPEEQA